MKRLTFNGIYEKYEGQVKEACLDKFIFDTQDEYIDELEGELDQQRFNNKNNLSIDQSIADRIEELTRQRDLYKKVCDRLLILSRKTWGGIEFAPDMLMRLCKLARSIQKEIDGN